MYTETSGQLIKHINNDHISLIYVQRIRFVMLNMYKIVNNRVTMADTKYEMRNHQRL